MRDDMQDGMSKKQGKIQHIQGIVSGKTSPTAMPARMQCLDDLGRTRTLDTSPTAFARLPELPWPETDGSPLVLLGLGPDPQCAKAVLEHFHCENALEAETGGATAVFWLEAPDFEAQMPETWQQALPQTWKRLQPEDVLLLFQRRALRFFCYKPGLSLFSSFWGPLTGALCAAALRTGSSQKDSGILVIPGGEQELLTRELAAAAVENGFTPFCPSPAHSLTDLLRNERPALYLSVNLRGLDPAGNTFRLLQACGVPVAIWFVDNPWHLLSGLRQAWWKEAALFTTDASFVAPLRRHGAAQVHHLPLGAWMPPPSSELAIQTISPPLQTFVFVGRSAFPQRERFFAGCRPPSALWAEALARLQQNEKSGLPHVQWWESRLEINECWPGKAIRQAGAGAEDCSRLRRSLWLQAAAPFGLSVFGDAAWRDLLPKGSDLRQPLDYYTALSHVYAQATYSLNVTSLLLPCGLTQRHFDVWTAGGFLLSDASPGLEIFPEELVRPMAVPHPSQLALFMKRLEKDSLLRPQLSAAWRACLLEKHSYKARLGSLLLALGRKECFA